MLVVHTHCTFSGFSLFALRMGRIMRRIQNANGESFADPPRRHVMLPISHWPAASSAATAPPHPRHPCWLAPARLPHWPHRSDPATRRRFRADRAPASRCRAPLVLHPPRRAPAGRRRAWPSAPVVSPALRRLIGVRLCVHRVRRRIVLRPRSERTPDCQRDRERQRRDCGQPKAESSRGASLQSHNY